MIVTHTDADVVLCELPALRVLLDEAVAKARSVFCEHLRRIDVSLFRDPGETSPVPLIDVCLVLAGDRKKMRRLLNRFDDGWWVDAVPRAENRMMITGKITS